MAQQLSLPLPGRSALGREDYFISPANAPIVAALDEPGGWSGGALAIIGGQGAGKSHLVHVFASDTGARIVDGAAVSLDGADDLAQSPLAIDGADRVPEDEALLHIYNLMRERKFPLLMTAPDAPARWTVELADLKSRLLSISVAQLPEPDDLLLTAVVAKHFSDRGIAPPHALIPFIVTRMERSLHAAGRIVAQLDEQALMQGRPIGVRLARDVLDKMDQTGA